MRKVCAVALLGLGVLTVASAATRVVPEIDAPSGINALALLAGSVLVVRRRRRK